MTEEVTDEATDEVPEPIGIQEAVDQMVAADSPPAGYMVRVIFSDPLMIAGEHTLEGTLQNILMSLGMSANKNLLDHEGSKFACYDCMMKIDPEGLADHAKEFDRLLNAQVDLALSRGNLDRRPSLSLFFAYDEPFEMDDHGCGDPSCADPNCDSEL